jgi:hypothetical protein
MTFTPGEFVIYILGPVWFIDGDIAGGIPGGRYAFGGGPPGPGCPIGFGGNRLPGDVIRKPKN